MITSDPKLASKYVDFLGVLIESGFIEAKVAENTIFELLAEYRSDYTDGAEIVSLAVKIFAELDAKSTTIDKCRRMRDILRRLRDQTLQNKSCIVDNVGLLMLCKNDAKLQADIDLFKETCTDP